MGFNFGNLKSDIRSSTKALIQDFSTDVAEWGIDSHDMTLSAFNTLTIWDDLDEYSQIFEESRLQMQIINKNKNKELPALLYPRLFQMPTLAPCDIYSHTLNGVEHSYNAGMEAYNASVYAIDGSDQVAYEFTRGHKGGLGVATYGWCVIHQDKTIDKHPKHKMLQLVPANLQDLQDFALINFSQNIKINPDTRVRNFAALRRTQLEFLQLSHLIDIVKPGSIIILDGFLKAMLTPPVQFIHEIGKRAKRKGIIIIGVAKNSKIDMWLHFQEYWKNAGEKNIGWIRPPAPILDRAFPSHSDEDANQYLYLGERGRGIGIPIGASLSSLRRQYYMVDFNCYDFEATKSYLNTSRLPEVHGKFFPLTTRDKDFISYVIAQLSYYSSQITALGYPFPAGAVHGLVKIEKNDVEHIREVIQTELLKSKYTLSELYEIQEDPHKILDSF